MKKTKITIVLTSLLMFLLIFNACEKDLVESNFYQSKTERLTIKNVNVPIVSNDMLKTSPKNVEWVFTLIADVESPTVSNSKLQATHVEIEGDFAYVSYNMRGSQNLGAIDIINISNPNNPQIINTLLFDDKDVNTIGLVGGNIYFGGQDMDGGYMAKVDSDLEGSDIVIFSWGEQTKPYSLNSMDSDNNNIWFTGGDNGGLYMIDSDDGDGIITVYEIFDTRSVKSLSNGEVYVLSGNDIHLWDGEVMSELGLIENNWIQQHSKADIDANDDYLFAATNRGGGLIIDIRNTPPVVSQVIERPLTPGGMDDENYVTNSVSVNNNLLFWAQGGAGIMVQAATEVESPLYEDKSSSLPFQELGYFDFGGPLSSNFVTSRGNIIFVASGLGGLKILKFEDSGLPDDFQPGVVCETLKDNIIEMFPERVDATQLHPYLFNENLETRIITDSETEVWVQFVWEGAGWKNTFGYYTYELGNEPTSVSELNKNVVFPNVSGVNEGGGLVPGDMVFIGEFPANTVIGFYLVAQGWQNGEMVNGIYTHYTDINLNPNNTQQHLLFTENCCDELVLTFEDTRLPSGDKDFNDIMLTIKDNGEGFANLSESFKTENLYFIGLCGGENVGPENPGDDFIWVEETAYVGSELGGGNAWWYYFDTNVKASHPIYAGQSIVDGATGFFIDGVLTIDLGENMILQNVDEPVKIQGYDEVPVSRPASGLFTTYKGSELVIEVPDYPYYVIHLDVMVKSVE